MVGAVGLVLIALLLVLAGQASNLPLIGSGPTYYAEFTEVGGLKKGDDVRMSGVLVGEVSELELNGDKVRVAFKVKDERDRLGKATGASIRIKTLLGAMYISLDPAGSGTLETGSVIPASRTTPPYDIVQAFSDLSTTTQEIDTDQLSYSMKVLGEVTAKTPESFRQAVDGVTRLSENLAARDKQIETLLKNVDGLSGVLADRNAEVVKLFEDGGVLFDALTVRREAIHDVLVGTTAMADEIEKLIADTREDLKPALKRLAGVVKVLEDNQKNIETALQQLPAYYSLVANNGASGPWLDGYLYNLLSLLGLEDVD